MRPITRARALSRILFERRLELGPPQSACIRGDQFRLLRAGEDELLALLDSVSESQSSAMREREIRRVLFALVPVALLFVDRNGTVCEANDAAEHLLGPALTGRTLGETLLPHREPRLRIINEDLTQPVEMRALSPQGTHFSVRVTCHSLSDGSGRRLFIVEPIAPSRASSSGEPASNELRWARLLVVEDDTDFRELLTKVLSEGGARVFSADNGAEGLRMIDACTPDVIVSDIVMPVMDGYTFIRRIRARQLNIPAIALTGLAAELDTKRAMDAGFDVHLQKPIEPSELVERIRQLVESGRSSRVIGSAVGEIRASEHP